MFKAKVILTIIKFLLGGVALGIGIWYMSSSISGASVGYASIDSFLTAIGVQNGDIATANGCFLCGYIEKLFAAIGGAAEMFWTTMIDNLWILMAIGFGIFLIVKTGKHIYEASKKTGTLDGKEQKFEFKPWFNDVWKQGVRVLIAGVFLGALGMGGTTALRTVTDITITPVMLIGSELSMAASGVSNSTQCVGTNIQNDDVLNPVLKPFMCVMGNLNTVMLAGASGGFALMNYAWIDDTSGGIFTWVAGLALIIMFLIIGFDLLFQILSVIFKLVFLIIFLPLIIAAAAFEGTWNLAKSLVPNIIGNILVKSAVQIVGITLKILIIYATVSFAADEYFPGPNDGYNAILPPLMEQTVKNPDEKTMSIMAVFSKCEQVAMTDEGVDKETFKNCFTAQRATVERKYPGAFDFMKNGWEFLLLMVGIFLLYYYAINKRIDKMVSGDANGEQFDYGKWIKDIGQRAWNIPANITEKVGKALAEEKKK